MSTHHPLNPKVNERAPEPGQPLNMFVYSFGRQLVMAAFVVCSISGFFFFLNRRGLELNTEAALDYLFGVSIGVSLWLSMGYLNSWLAPKVNWIDKPWQALLIVLPANIVVATLALGLVRFTFFVLIFDWPIEKWIKNEGIGDYYVSVLIGLFISAIYQAAWFIKLWKSSLVQAEQLKSANLSAQVEALNAQVNPHFLFNSLNVLSNLVRTNPEKAEEFIQGLSQVYRYVLDIRKEEIVPLPTELKALSNYTALVKTRFGERIEIDDQLSPKLATSNLTDRKVMPLALQMLVENAVKHNGATQKHPLHIKLFEENGWIVITNNRPPIFENPSGNGVGLQNIQDRYLLLADKQLVIEDTDDAFTVKLPLL